MIMHLIQTSLRRIVPMRLLTKWPKRLFVLEKKASTLLCWLYSLRNASSSFLYLNTMCFQAGRPKLSIVKLDLSLMNGLAPRPSTHSTLSLER